MTDQMSLFGDCLVDVPSTEGIKYAGSKLKLLPKILELVKKKKNWSEDSPGWLFRNNAGVPSVRQAWLPCDLQ